MGEIRLQMIDSHISSHWWQELVKYFVNVGNSLEIRCWKEESEEIQQALQYGNLTEANYEVSIKGIVTKEFLTELLSENPQDKSIYNKMTKYFTINVDSGQRRFCSAHYGTEIYVMGVSDDDITFFKNAMSTYTEDDFRIAIN